MRPHDKRYNAIPLPEAPKIDATVAYVACRSPISDPFARFKNAEKNKRDGMVQNHYTYFKPWETIHESNPQEILERKEKVNLVPLLIMQGGLDDNVLPAFQEKFVATYKAAGGAVDYHLFEGSEHQWVAQPGPQTDKARAMVKAFIARQLKEIVAVTDQLGPASLAGPARAIGTFVSHARREIHANRDIGSIAAATPARHPQADVRRRIL